MKIVTRKVVFALCLLSGLGLLFIGLRFFTNPIVATIDYGVNVPTNGNYSLQHIKGVRDAFFGIAILVLLFRKQWQALGWILLFGTIIPAVDFCIVASSPEYTPAHVLPHLIAVMICVGAGVFYLKNANKLSL